MLPSLSISYSPGGGLSFNIATRTKYIHKRPTILLCTYFSDWEGGNAKKLHATHVSDMDSLCATKGAFSILF